MKQFYPNIILSPEEVFRSLSLNDKILYLTLKGLWHE